MTTDVLTRSVDGGREPRARSVSFLTFNLRLTEPGGVTVPGEPGQAHVMLDTGIDGQPHLPGTSLAGALREMVRGQRGADVADDWFGPILSGMGADAQASRVWALGSRRLDDAKPQLLSSTRIDRTRGAAADNTLRTEQVLPAGSAFEVFLRWDDAADGEVEDLAALVAAWQPLIGRGVSRGRGRCVVEAVRHGTLRLDDRSDLLLWLTLHGPELAREVLRTRGVAVRPASVPSDEGSADQLFRVPVTITGPWRIGTGEKPERGSREPIPLLRVGGRPVAPGTATKGLLRSRAEFILRSVGVEPLPCEKEPCGRCWTCEVFGFGGGSDDSARAVGRRAAIRFADAAITAPVEATRTHIAIDRFTGGVLDGALYTTEVLEGGEFAIEASLLSDETGERRAEIAAVLRLVLEDLNDGIIGMGSGTARGYGSVQVQFDAASGTLPDVADAQRMLARMVQGGDDDSR
jgi:CRISPR/Cas system CSM-associated protein Csm3 (group 7 of RAMP superfamily)